MNHLMTLVVTAILLVSTLLFYEVGFMRGQNTNQEIIDAQKIQLEVMAPHKKKAKHNESI